MNKQFQPFSYQLNLNSNCDRSPGRIKRENVPKTISVLITPETNIYLTAKKICAQNKLRENLVLILAASISEQVEKQILEKQKNNPYQSNSSNFSQQSKTKSFKNRFCQSLQQSKCSIIDNQSTFRNTDFVSDPKTPGNSDEIQYSFRPATYLKMLDMTDDDEENSCISSINDFSVNHSYMTAESQNLKEIGKISTKNKIFQKRTKKEFNNLSPQSKILQLKQNMLGKKSVDKNYTSNFLSTKILQTKQQNLKQSSPFNKKSNLKFERQNRSPTLLYHSNSKQNFNLSRSPKPFLKTNEGEKQNYLSIYERGMIYRKISQQKLLKMKERQIIDQIKSCTFKPQLNSRQKSLNKKKLSTSFQKII